MQKGKDMQGNEYQKLAMRTNDGECIRRLLEFIAENQAIDGAGVINASFGLSGETGELNDMLKKTIFHKHPLEKEKMKKELGDIMWYVAMMCESMHFDLDEIMQMNIDKLKARYPEGFDPEKSQHRAVGDI